MAAAVAAVIPVARGGGEDGNYNNPAFSADMDADPRPSAI